MYEGLIIGAIISLILVSAGHSILGEKFIISPLLKYRGNRVLEHDLARLVLRFAWHILSIAWIVMAVVLYALAFKPERMTSITLYAVGISFLCIGIFDLIMSKGKHVGWPLLTAVGAFSFGAAMSVS